MKTLLTLCLLLVALCADAAFYQYNRYSTNFDTTLINGINLTNISGTNLVLSTVNSNKFDPPTLALFGAIGTPTITQTNFISGFAYTNTSGRPLLIMSGVDMTVAGVNGAVNMFVQCDTAGGTAWGITNRLIYGTTVSVIPDLFVWQMQAMVGVGWSYVWTNVSTGAGNVAALRSATGFIMQY